jgi:inosine/xanthosine triphosphate pyrophosphatase family protein
MTLKEKNAVSHRGMALRKAKEILKETFATQNKKGVT